MDHPKAKSTLLQIIYFLENGRWPEAAPPEGIPPFEAHDLTKSKELLLVIAKAIAGKQEIPINYINITEFRKKGYLQEANRRFFHPLGLALEVRIEENGAEYLSGVWDYRNDPDGIQYESVDGEKVNIVEEEAREKAKTRREILGWVVQPPGILEKKPLSENDD